MRQRRASRHALRGLEGLPRCAEPSHVQQSRAGNAIARSKVCRAKTQAHDLVHDGGGRCGLLNWSISVTTPRIASSSFFSVVNSCCFLNPRVKCLAYSPCSTPNHRPRPSEVVTRARSLGANCNCSRSRRRTCTWYDRATFRWHLYPC